MSEVRLQVKNLCKSFGITKAVQNVSFNVNKGEVPLDDAINKYTEAMKLAKEC
ncbi:MAG: hypothetical protein EGQ17_06875, partial [Lachnospiraceae bacterium]|nr:hypothetical protein [Lachnospiraceae bacterium]MBD9157999.1 hypothetical protein [Lachnospiraceae bacterium]